MRSGKHPNGRVCLQARLKELTTKIDSVIDLVDAILDGLTDARRLFDHGTMEERKRVIRAFAEVEEDIPVRSVGSIR